MLKKITIIPNDKWYHNSLNLEIKYAGQNIVGYTISSQGVSKDIIGGVSDIHSTVFSEMREEIDNMKQRYYSLIWETFTPGGFATKNQKIITGDKETIISKIHNLIIMNAHPAETRYCNVPICAII